MVPKSVRRADAIDLGDIVPGLTLCVGEIFDALTL